MRVLGPHSTTLSNIFNFSSSSGYTVAPLVLIYMFLMTYNVEHLFMWLFIICISYLVKCMFNYFCQYINRLLALLLSYTNSVYILHTIPLSATCFANVFFQSVACFFILYEFVNDHEFIIFMKYNLSFFYDLCPFIDLLKKIF